MSGIVVLMLLPTLIVGTGLYLPRALKAARRWAASRSSEPARQPGHPPIEQLASDLRRLLGQHEAVRSSTGRAMRAHHLMALEAAITDSAVQAAAALGMAQPDRDGGRALARPELRRLLRSLGDAGLVLPATGMLLGAEGHL